MFPRNPSTSALPSELHPHDHEQKMEMRGIDPRTSRMLSERSTI
ncbi:unnamed protein product, partial [Vitis vinifera]